MNKVFLNAATCVESKSILDWKKEGKKIVGYTCSYVPAEIFHAADILPVRLRGIETESMAIGDAYFGPYICSFPKCILQLAGEGKFSFLDGTIITPGCDSMRRLDECWRKAGDDYKGIVPSFFYYFDVPHKTAPHGMDWFTEEIRKLIAAVEDHFNVTIAQENLLQSIKEYNKGRRLLKQLEDIRCKPEVAITGTEAFAAAVAGTVMPREEYTRNLTESILHEGIKVAAANGYHFKKDFHEFCMNYLDKAGHHRTSMHVDIEKKNPTEIGFINGKIVKYGKEKGIPTPINSTIVSLIKGSELPEYIGA